MPLSKRAPLSAKAVASLKTSAFVGGAPGLQMVVSPGGTRAWRLYYRVAGSDGRRRALSLGRYPDVSLAEARRRAGEALGEASAGSDPKQERAKAVQKREVTLKDVTEQYLTACASRNEASTLSDKTTVLTLHALPALGARPTAEIARSELLGVIDALAPHPVTQRKLFAYLRHLFGWAAERDLAPANPLLGVKAPKTGQARERVLADAELAALWTATGPMAEIARLCLLTAQRKGSIEAMSWSDVDESRATWTIPGKEMKSGKVHVVPMSELALEIVMRQHHLRGPFIFGVGSDGAKPFNGASKGMVSLRRQVGFPDWRLHDLRRTAVTLAQRGGASLEEIRALTQHKTPGVIGVYARHAYTDEKRRVVEIIEREISGSIG